MLVGARLGPDSPHREFAFLFTQSEAGGGFSALSPEMTCSDVHVSECRVLRVGCGEAERAASETMDKSQGKRSRGLSQPRDRTQVQNLLLKIECWVFPGGSEVKNLPASGGYGFNPWSGKIPMARSN